MLFVMRHAKCHQWKKRNETEKCRMGLQKSEIEVEATENGGAPRYLLLEK